MISQSRAKALSNAYRDIEAAEKILELVDKEIAQATERRGFHGEVESTAKQCKLEWPSGQSSYTIYWVEPAIARAVLVAHLSDQKNKLEKLNAIAKIELISTEFMSASMAIQKIEES